MMIKRVMIFFVCVACLAACTPSLPKVKNRIIPWPIRLAKLTRIHAWTLQGSVIVKAQKTAVSATMHWQQLDQFHYVITLLAPLGMSGAKIYRSPDHVLLVMSDGRRFTGHSANSLLKDNLHWSLPVDDLYYWLRGMPAPKASTQPVFDRYHRVRTINGKHWVIHYLRYTTLGNLDLPQKISMVSPSMWAVLTVDSWHL